MPQKQALPPLLILLLGLAAVGAVAVMLFLGDDPAEPDPPPAIHPMGDSLQDREVTGRIRDDARKSDGNASSEGTLQGPGEVVQVLPEKAPRAFLSGMRIRLKPSGKRKLPPRDEIGIRVLFHDRPVKESLKPGRETGTYILENLLPGKYRIRIRSSTWAMGSATARLLPGEFADVTVRIGTPAPIAFQAVDQVTGLPVPGARINCPGFVDGGVTDPVGFFRSKRRCIPDSETVLRIQHPDYFMTLFEPLAPGKSGARFLPEESHFILPLIPLSGELTFAGTLVDGEGRALPRWALYLDTGESGGPPARSAMAYTNNDGSFAFTRLRPGDYRIRATLRLLVTPNLPFPPAICEERFHLDPGRSIEDHRLVCVQPQVRFRGFIFNAMTRLSMPGVTLSYKATAKTPFPNGEDALSFNPMDSDAAGAFVSDRTFLPEEIFRILLTGSLEIHDAEGRPLKHRPLQTSTELRELQADIVMGSPVSLWVVGESKIRIPGRVLDAHGHPVSQVRLSARSGTGLFEGHHRAFSDGAGYFELQGLFPGEWVIQAVIPEGPIVLRDLTIIEDGEPPELLVKLTNDCRIEGTVTCGEVPGKLNVQVMGKDFETLAVPVAAGRTFTFSRLPPGRARIVLEAYMGRRFSESTLEVFEKWVDLVPGKTVHCAFEF